MEKENKKKSQKTYKNDNAAFRAAIETEMQQNLGERLRIARIEAKLDQKEAASMLKIDQSKISLMERGERKVDAGSDLPYFALIYKKPISWFYNYSPLNKLEKEYFLDLLIDESQNMKLNLSTQERTQLKQFIKDLIKAQIKLIQEIKLENNILSRPTKKIKFEELEITEDYSCFTKHFGVKEIAVDEE